MSEADGSLRARIASVVQGAEGDRTRTQDLFQYAWTMVCVQRGLMRVVREMTANDSSQLVVEEVRSGRLRMVAKPQGLDADVERLAVEAMATILAGK